MPIHNFICDECNIVVHDTNTHGVHKCPKCGGDMWWDLKVGGGMNYTAPVHSDSLAITPDQVAEHKKLFPNIEIDGQCRPIFDNYVDHEAYLKKTGFVKHTQKLKPKGIRIA